MQHNKYKLGKQIGGVWVMRLALLFISVFISMPFLTTWAWARPVTATAPGSFTDLVNSASRSVVNISVVKVVKGSGAEPMPFGPDDPFKDFFERFFRGQLPREFKQRGLGTGFIIDKVGFILTNNHVVENADELKVRLADNKDFDARVIGRDPKTDLALIKINPGSPLSPLPLGDSDRLQVGEWVVAIGNPFGLGNTVTAGIVSAKYRQIGAGDYDNFIQTDASINPGNSGGPLLNTAGEVVGINSAIFSQSGGSVGIGFAIPINMAKVLLPQLKTGKVVRGWLGVIIQPITPELKLKLGLKDEMGALVADVTPGGPADNAGILRGDVIVLFDGKQIKESNDLPFMVASTPVGKTVPVEIIRKRGKETIQIRVGEFKEEDWESSSADRTEIGLGLSLQEITPELARKMGLSEITGLLVAQVEEDGPAAEAGIMPGDIILEMEGILVKNFSEFNQKIKGYKKGETILFLVKRQGTTLFLTLTI
ncbi:MAG: DegQ family serine endoprotease [Thermodesulfobacteriota bacterium]|nr:DegQ family serine endoprotease [Thermodesulfobacteriota bacterium]